MESLWKWLQVLRLRQVKVRLSVGLLGAVEFVVNTFKRRNIFLTAKKWGPGSVGPLIGINCATGESTVVTEMMNTTAGKGSLLLLLLLVCRCYC